MQTHGPKRVYTPRSVEFWFEKLSDEWETAFTARQLDEGARMYREGEVRELELTDKDAIVHRRVEKRDEYAVIEWIGSGLQVRSSSTDLDVARALAVAGLHEIEELVADEVSPLPGDYPADATVLTHPGSGAATPANGSSGGSTGPTPVANHGTNGHGASSSTNGHGHGSTSSPTLRSHPPAEPRPAEPRPPPASADRCTGGRRGSSCWHLSRAWRV
jgi:hypothetical protein